MNALLAAVRELAGSWRELSASDSDRQTVPEDLSHHIFAEFRELQQERYSHNRLVPIYEIRQRIAQKFGAAASRHEVFDEHVKRLWRQGKVRLVPISDLRDATAQQLNDSIPGVNETHFYLEHARELAVSGR